MDNSPQVPLLELKLPTSQQTVSLRKWLSIGQSRLLQKIVLKGGSVNPQEGTIGNVPAEVFLEMQDKAAELLINQIRNQDGSIVTDDVANWLFNLPQEDGNLIYDKLNEIISNSNLSDDSKKK